MLDAKSVSSKSYRDYSIDILKFLAVFLIINSHMDALYVKYGMLATGGAIGDVLFLFASGYTLFLSKRNLRFDNWYKRRINRIYPSVFMCVTMGALFMNQDSVTLSKLFGGGQFVVAIMAYYVLIYWIKKFALDYIPHVIAFTGAFALLVYVVWFPYKYEFGENGMYGITTLFRWIPYFAFMLFGAWMGLKRDDLKYKPIMDFTNFLICLMLFYGIQLASKKYPVIAPLQIVTLLPLLGVVFYFYKWCHAGFWKKLYANRIGHAIVMTISGLCLESYLIQFSVFTTKMNNIFPLNLPIMVVIVLLAAFLCKCLARFFSQTFKEGDYDWKEMVKPY